MYFAIVDVNGNPKLKLYNSNDIDKCRYNHQTQYSKDGKIVDTYHDIYTLTLITTAYNNLDVKDKLIYADKLHSVLDNMFINSKGEYVLPTTTARHNHINKKISKISVNCLTDGVDDYYQQTEKYQIIKSNFVVDEVYDKYINTIPQNVDNCILVAPCSSGKTTLDINIIKQGKKRIIAEPTISLCNQVAKQGDLYCRNEEITDDKPYIGRVVCYNSDSVDNVKDCIIDEVHNFVWNNDYYAKITDYINRGCLANTATLPPFSWWQKRGYVYYSTQNKQSKVNIINYYNTKKNYAINQIMQMIIDDYRSNRKCLVYIDDKTIINALFVELSKYDINPNHIITYCKTNIDSTVDDFGSGNTSDFLDALNGKSDKMIMLTTLRGVNGLNANIDNLHIIIYNMDIINTVQASCRNRLDNGLITIVNRSNYKLMYSDDNKIYNYTITDGTANLYDISTSKDMYRFIIDSKQMINILISELRKQGFDDIEFANFTAEKEEEKTQKIDKKFVVSQAVLYYNLGGCNIQNRYVDDNILQWFKQSSNKKEITIDNITYANMFDLFFCDLANARERLATNKVYDQSNVFDKIALSELDAKSKKKMYNEQRKKTKPYDKKFVVWLKQNDVKMYDAWKSKHVKK